jgi:hypothetical protein
MEGSNVKNFLDANWWGYGYKRYLIFRNSVVLFGLFFFLNLIWFDKILYRTYRIAEFIKVNNFRKLHNKRSRFHYVYNCFLYTLVIFWGLKLSYADLKLNCGWLVLLVIMQYLTGLLCVAYLAGYIIQR